MPSSNSGSLRAPRRCESNSHDLKTFQGVDYVNATDSLAYADAWVVPETKLSAKTEDGARGTGTSGEDAVVLNSNFQLSSVCRQW